jgi:hypothetical protein
VSTERNQANITVSLSSGLMICPNYGQASIFTRRTRVRLQGARMEPSNLAEVFLKFLVADFSHQALPHYVIPYLDDI